MREELVASFNIFILTFDYRGNVMKLDIHGDPSTTSFDVPAHCFINCFQGPYVCLFLYLRLARDQY